VAPDDGIPKRVSGSTAAFTLTQIRDLYVTPDWHPGDHPPMPEVLARGRKPNLFACGYCHYPNGQGRPENSSLAGLSAGYIAQQIKLVAQIEFTEWTPDGHLRHSSFVGQRDDKEPREITRET
jgi:cytochrome c553